MSSSVFSGAGVGGYPVSITSPSNDQVLTYENGTWINAAGGGGGGTPGGAVNSIQYNNAGSFGGFGSWNSATSTLTFPSNYVWQQFDWATDFGGFIQSPTLGGDVLTDLAQLFGTFLIAANDFDAAVSIATFGTGDDVNPGLYFLSAGGVVGTPTRTLANRQLGDIQWNGYTGTDYVGVSRIRSQALADITGALTANARVTINPNSQDGSVGEVLITGANLTVPALTRIGGTSSSFPALKRSSTIVQARLADDSDFAPLQGSLRTAANATTGLVAGVLAGLTNASIVITDASGQAYRVPCLI